MGGNAIQNASRLSAKEFHEMWDEFEGFCFHHNLPISGLKVKSYSSKESFGDLDVLTTDRNALLRIFGDFWKITETVKNGPVTSIGVELDDSKIFQIDLIEVSPEDFYCALAYFSFNDLGNLMGRIAHAMGLKYGHDGLWYILRDGDQVLDEICLSKDPKEIFCHLGFDFERFSNGFDTLESIFRFVTQSRFFDANLFPLEHRSHAARVRDAKRKTYREFLNFIANIFENEVPNKFERFQKVDFIPYHAVAFSHLMSRIDKAVQNQQRLSEVKRKFNGNLVRMITGLRDKELGTFISEFKNLFDSINDFNDWVLRSSESMIWREICKCCDRFHLDLSEVIFDVEQRHWNRSDWSFIARERKWWFVKDIIDEQGEVIGYRFMNPKDHSELFLWIKSVDKGRSIQ